MLQRTAIMLLLALSMSAAAEAAAQQRPRGEKGLPTGMTDANIMAHLASSDSLEIQMSQMALSHLTVEDVRDFAQMLIRDHTADLQKGLAAVRSAGITPTPAPGDMGASRMMAMMHRMMGQNGGMHADTGAMAGMGGMDHMMGNMDSVYVSHNMQLHARALRQLRAMRAEAQSPAVQQQIDAAVPMIEKHLKRAMQLAHKLKIPVDTTGRMNMRGMRGRGGMRNMNGMPMPDTTRHDTTTATSTMVPMTGTPAPAAATQVPAPSAASTGANPAINATNGGMNAGMGSSTSGMNNGTINGTNGANGAGTVGANAVNNGSLGGTTAGNPASRVPPIQPGRVTPPPKKPKVSSDSSGHHPQE